MAEIIPYSWNSATTSFLTKGTDPDSPGGISEFPVWLFAAKNWYDDKPLFAFWEDGGAVAAPPLSLDEPIHLAAVYDGTYVKLYVNGVLQDQNAFKGEPYQSQQPLWIGCGCYDTMPVDFFSGCISDVFMFNKALNVSEVMLYANENPGFTP